MNDALSAVSINLAQTFLLSLILPHRSFIILKSIFRPVVHFEIISVCGKELNSVGKNLPFSTEMLSPAVCVMRVDSEALCRVLLVFMIPIHWLNKATL